MIDTDRAKRQFVIGIDKKVPIRDGKEVIYVNFDNAASTPPISPVVKDVLEFLPYYASVHRGHGYKSQVSTEIYDQAHQWIGEFFKYDPAHHLVIFGKNATEAINKAAYRVPFPPGKAVLTTRMEHHSNDLPWRLKAKVRFVETTPEGQLDLEHVERELKTGMIGLLTVSGASNVTGIINPLSYLADLAHDHGALFMVDAAQLAPHAPLQMGCRANGWSGPDLIAISGHKMYAPFGSGALIGPKELFHCGVPEYLGGGTVVSVSGNDLILAEPPSRDEAGSPNVIGAHALAKAVEWLDKYDMIELHRQETTLTGYAYELLRRVPGCHVYGPSPTEVPRVSVISFNLEDIPHGLVAAALSHEAGIGVRHGCFCARTYVHRLLGLGEQDLQHLNRLARNGLWERLPGMVRISFGFYNSKEEVDYFISALQQIAKEPARLFKEYQIDPRTRQYKPGMPAL
jgi:cysteine desulfurase/selenocysteine lyase